MKTTRATNISIAPTPLSSRYRIACLFCTTWRSTTKRPARRISTCFVLENPSLTSSLCSNLCPQNPSKKKKNVGRCATLRSIRFTSTNRSCPASFVHAFSGTFFIRYKRTFKQYKKERRTRSWTVSVGVPPPVFGVYPTFR